jgi:hypothetical protein
MANNTVPKSITRINEEWNGFPIKYVLTVFTIAAVSLILVAVAFVSERGRWAFISVLFVTWVIFFKFLRTPAIMNRSWLVYQFLLKSMRGEHIIAKFTLPAAFLESLIPIRLFYNDGLIEFADQQYGLLARIEPSRISDDEVEDHIQRVRGIVDALHGSLLLKFYVTSVQRNGLRALEKNVINIINKETRTKEQTDHLYSIYHQAHDAHNNVIEWQFFLFLGLGVHKNIDEAQIAKKQYFPGLEARLNKIGVVVIPLKDKMDLASAYRKCITQGGY